MLLSLYYRFSGYILVRAIEREIELKYFSLSLLYIFVLEIALSLPVFLIVLAVLLFDTLFYPARVYIKRCKLCVALFSVILIDAIYFVLILIYDFIFSTNTIEINSILYYSLYLIWLWYYFYENENFDSNFCPNVGFINC